jgi:CheY-specific phosphatase CheX
MIRGIQDIGSWAAAFYDSTKDLARDMLGGVPVKSNLIKHEMPYALLGAFIQVVCSEGPVLLGITANNENCDSLARLMLGMAEDEPVEETDSFDALAEMINILSGLVKTRLSERLDHCEIGLPIFLNGRLRAAGRVAVLSHEITIASFDCELVILALSGSSKS